MIYIFFLGTHYRNETFSFVARSFQSAVLRSDNNVATQLGYNLLLSAFAWFLFFLRKQDHIQQPLLFRKNKPNITIKNYAEKERRSRIKYQTVVNQIERNFERKSLIVAHCFTLRSIEFLFLIDNRN